MNGPSVAALGLAGGGLLFLWSGYHGAALTGSLRDLLQGRQPGGADVNPITGGAPTRTSTSTAGPGSGGALSHGQLEQLWTANGGDPGRADVAAAVAQAESSGVADATSSNPDGGMNVGLWQLDTRGKGSGYTVAQLEQPATNARLAVLGSANGSDWSAWATYASGAYRQYLGGS